MTEALHKPIFSDEIVKATELNRKSGAILSRAVHHPITIVRNDEYFTLMRREDIALIVTEAAQTRNMFEILNAAFLLCHDKALDSGNIYNWLRVFDREELQELVLEVSEAYRSAAIASDGWENLDAVIHEWHESAIAILSDDLTDAWQDTDEEVLLTQPVDYHAS